MEYSFVRSFDRLFVRSFTRSLACLLTDYRSPDHEYKARIKRRLIFYLSVKRKEERKRKQQLDRGKDGRGVRGAEMGWGEQERNC